MFPDQHDEEQEQDKAKDCPDGVPVIAGGQSEYHAQEGDGAQGSITAALLSQLLIQGKVRIAQVIVELLFHKHFPHNH